MFFQFSLLVTLSHWYQDWVKVALACIETGAVFETCFETYFETGAVFETCFETGAGFEMQSDTRGVQSFGSKTGVSVAKPHASQRLCTKKWRRKPSSSKTNLQPVIVFFRTPYKSFVALE